MFIQAFMLDYHISASFTIITSLMLLVQAYNYKSHACMHHVFTMYLLLAVVIILQAVCIYAKNVNDTLLHTALFALLVLYPALIYNTHFVLVSYIRHCKLPEDSK